MIEFELNGRQRFLSTAEPGYAPVCGRSRDEAIGLKGTKFGLRHLAVWRNVRTHRRRAAVSVLHPYLFRRRKD